MTLYIHISKICVFSLSPSKSMLTNVEGDVVKCCDDCYASTPFKIMMEGDAAATTKMS